MNQHHLSVIKTKGLNILEQGIDHTSKCVLKFNIDRNVASGLHNKILVKLFL